MSQENRKFILVMGVTGAGKSHLISKISGKPIKVGHELESCTSEIEEVNIKQPDGSIVTLVDTPGFDDTNKTDTQILETVTAHLYNMYTENIKVTGIIYVHRISDIRMQGSVVKNLNMFEKLCGDRTFKNVVLLTTRWDMVPEDIGVEREKQLREKYWRIMVHKGSEVMRYRDDANIKGLMEYLLGKEGVNLLVQEELSAGKSLQDTGAGLVINQELLDAEKKYKKELEEVKAMMQRAMDEKDEETRAIIQEEADRMTEKIARIQEDKEALERNLREELALYRKQIDDAKVDKERIEREGREMEQRNRERFEQMERNYKEQQEKLDKQNMEKHAEMERRYKEDREARERQEDVMRQIQEDNIRRMEEDRRERREAMERNFTMEKEERERREAEMRKMHEQQMAKMERDRDAREQKDREMERNHQRQMAEMEEEKRMRQAEMDEKFRKQKEMLEREKEEKRVRQAEMDRRFREQEEMLKKEKKNRTTVRGLAKSGALWALKPVTTTYKFVKEL